jgi:hypothetical protein
MRGIIPALRFLFCAMAPVIALVTCSDYADYSIFVNESFLVRQGPGQCGPASFYMIFRHYGDHAYDGSFRELPSCGADIPLQVELDRVNQGSAVSAWMGVSDSGIAPAALYGKISRLADQGCAPFYSVDGETTATDPAGVHDNRSRFDSIAWRFLLRKRPVIIHIERPAYMGIPVSGHYMVLVDYHDITRRVYFVDPNTNTGAPAVQSVPLDDFLGSYWYRSPDYSDLYPVPDGRWDGVWIGFYRSE